MKKIVSIILLLVLLFSMAGCAKQSTNVDKGGEEKSVGGEIDDAKKQGKVAIVTNTVSATEEEYRSADQLVEKYGEDRLIHVTWPENSATEQEQMITILTKLGADPDVKAIVINQAVPGTNAAVDKLKEVRDDILVVYCNYSENAPDVASRADVGLLGDSMTMGTRIAEQSQKLGAKTLVHYSFPRHLSIAIFSVRRDLMKAKCSELGIKFVDITAPDPTGDSGIAGTQQFILEDVPKQVDKYGKDTAFTATNCAMQIPLIQRCAELGAIYPVPCCPSPFHGYPTALGIDVPDDKKGDIEYVIEETRKKLDEYGVRGRFSNLPVPGAILLNNVGVDYAFKWMAGETNGKFDEEVLKKLMLDFAGVDITFSKLVDNGVTYDNLLLYLMDFIVY